MGAKDIVQEVWRDAETGLWRWRVTETLGKEAFVNQGDADCEHDAIQKAKDMARVRERDIDLPSVPEPAGGMYMDQEAPVSNGDKLVAAVEEAGLDAVLLTPKPKPKKAAKKRKKAKKRAKS